MDFALSADQLQMQASVAGVLDRVASLEAVRAYASGDESVGRDVWRALSELGVSAILTPTEFGGLGLGLLDATLIAETLGSRVAPGPFISTAVLVPLAIGAAGDVGQKGRWLPKLADGSATAGVALNEAFVGVRDASGVVAEYGRLTGESDFALDAADADVVLVADRDGSLHLVEAGAFEPTPISTIDATRRFARLRFAGAAAEPLPGGSKVLSTLRRAAQVILAADMLGASQAMLDKAVSYAKERRQFGRPIGSFQAVKHLCAEMAAEIEPARSLVWYSAYAFDSAPEEADLVAAHAKAHLSEVSRFVARTATEVHGGIGFTDLLGLHYWFKRIGAGRQIFGGPRQARDLAARLQGIAA